MNQKPDIVKQKLQDILSHMAEHSWLYVSNPGHDFTRQHIGKLSFKDTISCILGMGKGTTSDEIISFFDMDPQRIPSLSALVQRRSQIDLSAFRTLFDEFSTAFPQTTHQFKGRCILAIDGCHIVYTTNAEILEDYKKPRLADYKGYNHMHLNGFVDVVSKAFLDVVIQPGQDSDEREALHTMLDQFKPDHPEQFIITADRGYESYDLIFHCELKHLSYAFRVKSPSVDKCILASFSKELPDEQEEFDVTVERFFTDKKTTIMQEQQEVYHYMNPSKRIPHFQALLGSGHLAYLKLRVVKIKTAEDTYEYILTNLPSEFTIDDIKQCYHWRWGIETSFRYLKHAAGLLYFHSRKPEFLKQEIYASLVMYNFGVFLANEAADHNQRTKRRASNKYLYEIDFSTAIRTARQYYLRDTKKAPIDIIGLLCKFVHAVKEQFRKFERPMRGIGAIHFSYR